MKKTNKLKNKVITLVKLKKKKIITKVLKNKRNSKIIRAILMVTNKI